MHAALAATSRSLLWCLRRTFALCHHESVRLIASIVLSVLAACSSSSEIEVDHTHCLQLRDHLVDLRLATAKGVDVRAHKRAMTEALGERFVNGCQATLSSDQLECGLHARDLAHATACTAKK